MGAARFTTQTLREVKMDEKARRHIMPGARCVSLGGLVDVSKVF